MATEFFPLPPKYIFHDEVLGSGLGHSAIVVQANTEKLFLCKSIKKDEIGNEDKIQRFRERLDHIQSVRNPYVLSYNEIIDTKDFLLLIRPYIQEPPLIEAFAEANLNSSNDNNQNPIFNDQQIFSFWKNICNCFLNMHSHHISPNFIKPTNIFIIRNSAIVVTDLYPPPSDIDVMIHSPNAFTIGFLAPEFFNQGRTGSFSDLWSLGVLFSFMLTRSLPWSSKNIFTMLQQINTCNIKFSKPISPAYEEIIRNLLQIDPDKRVLNIEKTSNDNTKTDNDSTDKSIGASYSALKMSKPTSYRPDYHKNATGRVNVGFMHLQANDFSSRSQNGAQVQLRSTTTRLLKTDGKKSNFMLRSRAAPTSNNSLNGSQIKLPSLNKPM
ncbi:hypothetical protein M9Y10_028077 [Tritrichomonas musculus]|uniref:Protein kinase domain-containing protein n=1 Tax=Tritrichomonas musculus TaxID=1915356 RepID=A0ABR2KIS9_9EUKA